MSQRTSLPYSLVAALGLAVTLGSGACASAPTQGHIVLDESLHQPYDVGGLAPAMGWSCGTLDCHGNPGRNLRLYSQYGLRLGATDTPGGMPITQSEIDADYRSTSALEPEIMNQVIADGGAHPERLTLIRKARGTEHHKGGAVTSPPADPSVVIDCDPANPDFKLPVLSSGEYLDTCLTKWLANAPTDKFSCYCDAASQPP